MIYDLHTHTTASDGSLSPEELVLRAKEKGVDALAITDHDTISGLIAATEVAANAGVKLIPGIEFSCEWSGRVIHVVGLGINCTAPAIEENIQSQVELRKARAIAIAKKLTKLGIENALEGASAFADGGSIGRPHFAKFLIEQGHAKDFNSAFKRFLADGKPAYVKQPWPHISDVVGWVKEAGGIAVLAHPDKYKMTRTKIKALLSDFKSFGGEALEVISGKQTANITQNLAKLAGDFEMYASCGSDFHMPGQGWQELGAFGSLPPTVKPVWQCPQLSAG